VELSRIICAADLWLRHEPRRRSRRLEDDEDEKTKIRRRPEEDEEEIEIGASAPELITSLRAGPGRTKATLASPTSRWASD